MAETAKDDMTMARKAMVSYAGLSLGTEQTTVEPTPSMEPVTVPEPRLSRTGKRTLKETSAQVMLYLHPAAVKALKRYAVDQNVKVHDLLIEAVENWFQGHGLKEQVRAQPVRHSKSLIV